jgi:hypothetical protein
MTTTELTKLGEKHKILFNKEFASIYHFNDSDIAIVTWKGPCSFEEYKNTYQVLLDEHKRKPIKNFIVDIRNQGISSSEKKSWFKETALKQAIDIGLKKAVAIIDNNPFKQFYMNLILRTTNTMGIPFKTFNEIDQAKAWFDQ